MNNHEIIAKYKSLSEEIYWTCRGYNKNYQKESEIIKSNKMNIGDIVYVGTNNDTRPEWGWGFVYDNDGHYLSEDNGSSFLLDLMATSDNYLSKNHVKLKKNISEKNIKYEKAFQSIMKSELCFAWFDVEFYGKEELEVIIDNFKEYNLW